MYHLHLRGFSPPSCHLRTEAFGKKCAPCHLLHPKPECNNLETKLLSYGTVCLCCSQ
jgi:hypothetical protein